MTTNERRRTLVCGHHDAHRRGRRPFAAHFTATCSAPRSYAKAMHLWRSPRICDSATCGSASTSAVAPTDDKPEVIATPPQHPNELSGFMNLRVTDIAQFHELWRSRVARYCTRSDEEAGRA